MNCLIDVMSQRRRLSFQGVVLIFVWTLIDQAYIQMRYQNYQPHVLPPRYTVIQYTKLLFVQLKEME